MSQTRCNGDETVVTVPQSFSDLSGTVTGGQLPSGVVMNSAPVITNLAMQGTLQDSTGAVGLNGQLLSSTVTGTKWVTSSGGGSTPWSVQTISTSQSAGFAGATNTLILATAGAGGITLPLITAAGASGQVITIKKVDNAIGSVSVTTALSQTIDGAATYALTNVMQYVSLASDGSNWNIVGNN